MRFKMRTYQVGAVLLASLILVAGCLYRYSARQFTPEKWGRATPRGRGKMLDDLFDSYQLIGMTKLSDPLCSGNGITMKFG